MKKMKMLFVSALVAVLASSCGTSSTVPITGRKQNILVSDEQVLSLSNQQYQEYMQKAFTLLSCTRLNSHLYCDTSAPIPFC